MQQGGELKPAQEKRYGKLRAELVELMDGVHLNNARIEQLVEQLYDLNRALIGFEGKLLRMATNSKIKREDFLDQHRDSELDPGWLEGIKIVWQIEVLKLLQNQWRLKNDIYQIPE